MKLKQIVILTVVAAGLTFVASCKSTKKAPPAPRVDLTPGYTTSGK